jgi:hypothetical protein
MEQSMGTYVRGISSLAAFLLVGSPLSAQAPEDAPLKMVYAVWKSPGAAANIMSQMNKKTYDKVEAWAVIAKDSTGKVKVKQRHNKAGGSDRAMQAAVVVDTAVARLSALPPNAADSAVAYAPNGPASRLSEKDFKKVVSMLDPGESGVLLISSQPDVSEVKRVLGMGGQGAPEVVVVDLED